MSILQSDFTILNKTRANVRKLVTSCSLEQLNKIPEGFSNNIMWNFGHIAITQQLLCYKLSNTEMYVDNDLVQKYRKGSRPASNSPASKEEYDTLMSLFDSTAELLQKDYENNRFGEYKEYTTSYGTTLSNMEDAIKFNNVHEAMHLGQCIFLKKFV